MTNSPDLEQLNEQLCDLQSQVSFQEDTIQALNDVVAQQQQQMERLNEMLNMLRNQLDSSIKEGAKDVPSERPPHY